MFETVGSIVDALGGTNAVTTALGLKNPSTVSSWRKRGSIPPEHWFGLTALAKRRGVKGITFEALGILRARTVEQSEARA